MERKAFLDQEPPPGYIPGVGRGATGFTTSATSSGIAVSAANGFDKNGDNPSSDNEDNYDIQDTPWASLAPANDDDQLADRIYQEIDARISVSKPKGSDTSNSVSTVSEALSADFANLKRGLADITVDQWALLPEAGDMTRRNKRTRLLEKLQQRFYAVPDALLGDRPQDISSATDFELISSAKDALLSRHLDSLVSTTTDDNDEIQLDSLVEVDKADSVSIADLEKSRQALASLRRVEPNRASSWIASARLELEAKEYKRAKSLIVEGCERIPRSEDAWLESIRIHQNSFESNKLCKRIATTALSILPTSSKLWLKSVELESSADVFAKKRVVHKALLSLPKSGPLWKKLIELEDDPATVRMLLKKAIEMVPQDWELRQALIDVSDYNEARTVLNSALKTMKDDHRVWITALKIEEKQKGRSLSDNKLQKMLLKGMDQESFRNLDLDFWLGEAAKIAHEGFLESCKAIVFNALETRGDIAQWLSQADKFSQKNEQEVVQLIYEYIFSKLPDNEDGWLRLLDTFRSGSQEDRLFEYYKMAVTSLPDSDKLTVLYAMDTWNIKKDLEGARMILQKSNSKSPNQNIQLQRVKLEISVKNYEAAQSVFEEMVDFPQATSDAWYKYVCFARFHWANNTNYENEIIVLIDRSLRAFPKDDALHILKGNIYETDIENIAKAREAYSTGTKECPQSVNVWLSLSRLEIKLTAIRARSILDLALLKIPNNPTLWAEKIKLERSLKDMIAARSLANKALKLFKLSPIIWKEYVELIPKKSQQKNALNDALKATNNDSTILLMIGKLLWESKKVDNARVWFERGLKSNEHNGDCWGWLYSYYEKSGNDKDEFLLQFGKVSESIDLGECWLDVSNNIKNFELNHLQTLQIVSKQLLKSVEN